MILACSDCYLDQLQQLQSEMNRLFDRWGNDGGHSPFGVRAYPAMNVWEDGEHCGRERKAPALQDGGIPSPTLRMNPSQYETSDKYLGSFLLSQGATLAGYARVSTRRVVFRFVASERLHELLRLYRNLTAVPLVPLQFVAALRTLKRLARLCRLPDTPGNNVPAPATGSPESDAQAA